MALGQVPHMQTILAENIRKGIGGLGDRPLDEAKFGLEKAAQEYALDRQRKFDDVQMSALKRDKMVADQQIAQAKQPLTIGMLMKDVNSTEHWFWTPQDDPKRKEQAEPMISKVASLYGGTWDTKEGSPTRGQIVRPDGSVVTMMDVHRNAQPMKAFMMANTGLDHTLQSSQEKLLRSYQSGKISLKDYNAGLAQLEKFKNSPDAQIKYLDSQIEFLSQFTNSGNPLFNSEITNGVARLQRKREGLVSRAKELDERNFEKFKLRYERETKKMIAEIKAKEKGGDLTQKERDAFNRQRIEHVVGAAKEAGLPLSLNEDGNIGGYLTGEQVVKLKSIVKGTGITAYAESQGVVDMPGLSLKPWEDNKEIFSISLVPNLSEKGSQPVVKPAQSGDSGKTDLQKLIETGKQIRKNAKPTEKPTEKTEKPKPKKKKKVTTEEVRAFESSPEFQKPGNIKNILRLDDEELKKAKKKVKKQTKKSFLRTPPGN